jgi:hypothetical protein
MNKFASMVALALASGVVIVGCKKQSSEPPAPVTAQPAPSDSKVPVAPVAVPTSLDLKEPVSANPVAVAVNGTVTVSLIEDPTQNLKWVWDGNDNSGAVKKGDEEKRTSQPNSETRKFTFTAAKSGNVTLNFVYGPYTQEQHTPVRSVQFSFDVR